MIVVKITISISTGYLLSDVSIQFPSLVFTCSPTSFQRYDYKTIYHVKSDDGAEVPTKTFNLLLAAIEEHPTNIRNDKLNEEGPTMFVLRASEPIQPRSVSRIICSMPRVRRPKHSPIIIRNGERTVYASAKDKEAYTDLRHELIAQFGRKNVHTEKIITSEDSDEIFDAVPAFFSSILPEPMSDHLLDTLKDCAKFGVISDEQENNLFDRLDKHPWLIPLASLLLRILDMLQFYIPLFLYL